MNNLNLNLQEQCPLVGFQNWLCSKSDRDYISTEKNNWLDSGPLLTNLNNEVIASHFDETLNRFIYAEKFINENIINPSDNLNSDSIFNNLQQLNKSDDHIEEDEKRKKRMFFFIPLPNFNFMLPKIRSLKIPKFNFGLPQLNWNPNLLNNVKPDIQPATQTREIPNFLLQSPKTNPLLQKAFHGGLLIAMLLGTQLLVSPMLSNRSAQHYNLQDRSASSLNMKDFQISVDGIFKTLSEELTVARAQAKELESQLQAYQQEIQDIKTNPNKSLLELAQGIQYIEQKHKILDNNVLIPKIAVYPKQLIQAIKKEIQGKWDSSRASITKNTEQNLTDFASKHTKVWTQKIDAFKNSSTDEGRKAYAALTKYKTVYDANVQAILAKAKEDFTKNMSDITYNDIDADNPTDFLTSITSVDSHLRKKTQEQLEKQVIAVNAALKEAQTQANRQMFFDVMGDGTEQGMRDTLSKVSNIDSKVSKQLGDALNRGEIGSNGEIEQIIKIVTDMQVGMQTAKSESKLSSWAQWCYQVDEYGTELSDTPLWSSIWRNAVTGTTCNIGAAEIIAKTMTWEEQKQILIILGTVLSVVAVAAAVVTAPVWAPTVISAASAAAATVSGMASGIAAGVSTMVGTASTATIAAAASAKAVLATASISTIASVNGVAAAATAVATAHPIATMTAVAAGGVLIAGHIL